MATNSSRAVNIGLRAATLGARFLLLFFLARYLNPADVAYYGLFAAAEGYALYLVGLDFYTYVTREILRASNDERGRMLKGQAELSACLYLVMLPLGLLFLHRSHWPDHLAWWFFPILLLEHFNQEVSRLLIALSQQLTASVILFIRQGSWVMVLVALLHWNTDSRRLEVVMALWMTAGVAAAGLGTFHIRKLNMLGWRLPVNWAWVRRGVGVSGAFLAATLALRGIQTVDRYWMVNLGGIEMVGPYVLFMGVASALTVFLDAGLFAFAYPELIQHHHDGENDKARAKVRKLFRQAAACAAAFSVASWVLLPYLLRWINKPIYSQSLGLYAWLLSAMVVNTMSMIPHYALYARGHDRPIIYSHVAALVAFASSAWVLARLYGPLAIPIAINGSFALIFLWKMIAYQRLSRAESRAASSPLQTA